MKRALLLIGMLLAFDVQAQSTYLTGNNLESDCRGIDKNDLASIANSRACAAYVMAIADVMSTDSIDGFRACIPTYSVTVGQLAAVIRKYLRDNPERLHYTASTLVATAMSAAFPCSR